MNRIKIFINLFVCLLISFITMASESKPLLYKVKFDYVNYPKEREIVYQYLKNKYKDEDIGKEQIGIDLYDIDDDDKKEILAYLSNSVHCGSAGCVCVILKSIDNSDKYNSIFKLNIYEMKILKSKNLGFYDMSLSVHSGFSKYNNSTPPDSEEMIMRWQGDHYVEIKKK